MARNHHLAKSITDAGWKQLVRLMTYKAESSGRVVVQFDPRNTSQQ
ncbi:zinc ribbon domain-containing protein [Paenibacillus cremeus]